MAFPTLMIISGILLSLFSLIYDTSKNGMPFLCDDQTWNITTWRLPTWIATFGNVLAIYGLYFSKV